MRQLRKLPPAFKRFARIGGVLLFAAYEEASGSEDQIVEAMAASLREGFDAERLRALSNRRIDERTFFGDWYDHDSGSLLMLGDWNTADGQTLHNPRLKKLDRATVVSGAGVIPEAGAGGQFAYAFSTPPYSLRARPTEVQSLFEEIRDFILPPHIPSEIRDWSSPRLPEVSPYFALGMEWWGAFLFSIHVPALERLTIIAGSTSD